MRAKLKHDPKQIWELVEKKEQSQMKNPISGSGSIMLLICFSACARFFIWGIDNIHRNRGQNHFIQQNVSLWWGF